MKLVLLTFAVCIWSCNSFQAKQKNSGGDSTVILNKLVTDTIKRPFQIIFKGVSEIRMGSPYNTCEIEIIGTKKLQIPQSSWQDKFAWSDDSKKLALVKWDNSSENPTFKLFVINIETGSIQESIRMAGAINRLQIHGDTITYNKFYYNKAKSNDTLCCTIEEKYIIKK